MRLKSRDSTSRSEKRKKDAKIAKVFILTSHNFNVFCCGALALDRLIISFFLYLVIVQTYSNDINSPVPPIRPFILKRVFNALLENGVQFVNIEGEWGSNIPLSTPTLAIFARFFNIAKLHISSFFKHIPKILTLKF